jgi:hypothetical protein
MAVPGIIRFLGRPSESSCLSQTGGSLQNICQAKHMANKHRQTAEASESIEECIHMYTKS